MRIHEKNHLISCQLCFLLPSSCALHARSKSPAVPRAAPWVDEGHLHANLMTTSLVNFLFGLSLSVNHILSGPGVSNMLISFSKSQIPVIVVNPAAVKDHKISPLIRVYQPSQLVAGEKRCAASHGRRCWQLWCTVMGSEAQKEMIMFKRVMIWGGCLSNTEYYGLKQASHLSPYLYAYLIVVKFWCNLQYTYINIISSWKCQQKMYSVDASMFKTRAWCLCCNTATMGRL